MSQPEPDRKLAEVSDKIRNKSPRERAAAIRDYYRQARNEQLHTGEGRRYVDQPGMMNGGPQSNPGAAALARALRADSDSKAEAADRLAFELRQRRNR